MSTSDPSASLRSRPPNQWLRERDIDLLICSELHFDGSPLQKLFIGEWNGGVAKFGGAWVSYSDASGETDILALFESELRTLVLLIEDKIDAEFQPDQPERYRRRAQRWIEAGGLGWDVETVLLAPGRYFENEGSEIFDRQLSYEEVIEALSGSADQRTRFLADTLRNGIEAHRQGYSPVPDEATTRVWKATWEIARDETPQLRMPRPGSKPARAGFIEFLYADGLSSDETKRRAKIVYKLPHGHADLQFANMSQATLLDAVEGLLAPEMTVAQAVKSASIRVVVPPVDCTKPPEGQADSIREGLYAAERLRLFFTEKGPLALLPAT